MGVIQFITKEQQIILYEIMKNEFLRSRFYFTGGAALSSVYLNHRYSDDLDFFSEEKFENNDIFAELKGWAEKHMFSLEMSTTEESYVYRLIFPNKSKLRINFSYCPYNRIERGIKIDNLDIDGLRDIAANKLITVPQYTDVTDYVDLYFLLQRFSLWDLLESALVKFHMNLEPVVLSENFLKIENYHYLPKMILPLTIDSLKRFFRQKAKDVGTRGII